MRIQHNIMAMNAYRNYTNNVSAMQKNLEKLSSGYKINRAGDDAAGLAISEKMRAQISGLEAAQKNAKDGISLVQTAEGALTEVHDMLNRMVTLATQSANGTYDNTTDRYQLQKEMDQLNAEIDRIADSANFNGIKLLDGSMDASTKTSVQYSDINTKGVRTDALLPEATGTDETTGKDKVGTLGANTITYKENGEAQKTKFAVDLGKLSWTPVINDDTKTVKLQIQFPTKVDTKAEGAETNQGPALISFEFDVDDVESCMDENGKVNMADILKLASDDLKTAEGDDGHTGHMKIDIAGVAPRDPDAEGAIPYSGFDVSIDGTKVVFELCDLATAHPEETQANWGDIKVIAASFDENDTAQTGTVTGNDGFMGWNVGSTEMVKGVLPGDDRMANTVLDMSKVGFKTTDADAAKNDGWTITVDGKSYILAVGDSDMSKYSGNAVVVKVAKDATVDDQLRELANAINNGSTTWSVGANQEKETDALGTAKHNYGLTFAQIAKTKDEDLTTLEGIAAAIKTGKTSATTTTSKGIGKSLTLQIGDTAESFNQLAVDVADCHVKALGIGDVDISTQEGAAAAIDKIKAAINTVSDIRGTLGATQNRLDHTINNLSVMQENIQDAESTIRDVDVAEEMMAYTKNSILIQSAQAMLAQANQIPQGVLQLLG